MTSPFDDLDGEARATAVELQRALEAIRLDRPSPATTQQQDHETAGLLAEAFAGITHEAAVPAPTAQGAELVALPSRGPRRRRWPAVAAAAAVLLIASALLLGPQGSSASWAAVPRTPSTSDVESVSRACAAPLARGLGDLQSSGSVSLDGSRPVDPAVAPGPPTSLPPLVALDVRGDVAFAVYQDEQWTITCVATADGDAWRDQGVQVGPGSAGQQPGIVSAGGSASIDGRQITTVTGTAPAGTTRVTFRLDDGTEVQASIVGTTWAAWFPGDRRLEPGSITASAG